MGILVQCWQGCGRLKPFGKQFLHLYPEFENVRSLGHSFWDVTLLTEKSLGMKVIVIGLSVVTNNAVKS